MNKLNKQRPYHFYLFVSIPVCLFLWANPLQVSATENTLVFKKNLSQARALTYKVEKGDSIYSILRSFHQEKKDISALIQRVKRLNPGIQNINKIYPGQTIRLPGKLRQDTAKHTESSLKKTGRYQKYKTIQYTVKPGDYLVKILKKEADLSRKVIFNEYLNLFKRLNPDIADLKRIRAGQRITLPMPLKKTAQDSSLQKKPVFQGKLRSRNKSVDSTHILFKKNFPPNKYLALHMLKEMGFNCWAHKKIFFPYDSIKWHKLDTIQTPLLTAPWGQKFVLLSNSHYPESFKTKLRENGITICNIDNSWELGPLFEEIEKKSNKKLIYWNMQETLILNLDKHVLEIKGNYLFVLNISPRTYCFFIKSDPGSVKISSLLSGYLAKQNIQIYSLSKEQKKLTRVNTPEYPAKEDLYIPRKSRSEILSELNGDISGKKIKLLKRERYNFLKSLKKQNFALKKMLRMSCLQGSQNKMLLNIPVTKLLKTSKQTFLLSPELKNSYLLALMKLRGYPVYLYSPSQSANRGQITDNR